MISDPFDNFTTLVNDCMHVVGNVVVALVMSIVLISVIRLFKSTNYTWTRGLFSYAVRFNFVNKS